MTKKRLDLIEVALAKTSNFPMGHNSILIYSLLKAFLEYLRLITLINLRNIASVRYLRCLKKLSKRKERKNLKGADYNFIISQKVFWGTFY